MTTKVYIPREAIAVALGADEIADAMAAEARNRKLDIDIRRVGSRGMSWAEPLIEVEATKGRIGYANVAPGDVPGLFEGDFLDGGKHDACVGPVEDMDYLKRQERVTFSNCGLIDPLSSEEYQAAGGLAGLEAALKMEPEAIVEAVTESGLRGRGGAGFPTGIKWRTALEARGEKKYIVCNADEGDAGTFADRLLMEGDPMLLLEGMAIAGLATGAEEGVVYLRSEYPLTIEIFGKALEAAHKEGWLGENILGSGKRFEISLFVGAGAYICGEETSLLESLEGKRGIIRAKPPLPAVSGLFGKPTVVNNVLTLAAVPTILTKGAGFYAKMGTGRSLGTQPFQLGGNIKRGGLVEAPFGVTLRELVEGFGGGTRSGRPIKAVQVGGPLGAYLPEALLDLPADYEALVEAGAMLGHGGIILFDDTADLAEQARFAFEFCAHESCGKCTPCRIGAVRGEELMSRIIAGDKSDEAFELLRDLCEVMESGSLCAMGGLTPMPVKSALEHFPEDFKAAARDAVN